jgi:hypothetical protein
MYRRFLDTNPRGSQRDLAENHLVVVEQCGTGGLRISVMPPADRANVPAPTVDTVSPMSSTTSTSSDGSSRTRKLKRAGAYTIIGGSTALVGAAIFALDASSAARSVEQSYEDGGKWNDVKHDDARGKRSASIATGLGIGGGVAVITGAVLYGLGRHYEQAKYVAVTPTRNGTQVSLSWGF